MSNFYKILLSVTRVFWVLFLTCFWANAADIPVVDKNAKALAVEEFYTCEVLSPSGNLLNDATISINFHTLTRKWTRYSPEKDGRFKLPVKKYKGNDIYLIASHPKFASHAETGIVFAEPGAHTFKLENGFVLSGNVVNDKNELVKNAPICLDARPAEKSPSFFRQVNFTMTNEKGEFRFIEPPSRYIQTIRLKYDNDYPDWKNWYGHLNLNQTVRVLGPQQLKLKPAQELNLYFQDKKGNKIKNVPFYGIFTPNSIETYAQVEKTAQYTRIANTNLYTCSGPATEYWQMRVVHPEHESIDMLNVRHTTQNCGNIMVVLPDPARLFGEIKDTTTGKVIPDAQISYMQRHKDHYDAKKAKSDKNGNYKIPLPILDVKDFNFAAKGYVNKVIEPFKIEKGEQKKLDVMLTPGSPRPLQIYSESGDPGKPNSLLVNKSVNLTIMQKADPEDDNGRNSSFIYKYKTNSEGTILVREITDHCKYTIKVDGHLPQTFDPPHAESTKVITLAKAAKMELSIVDEKDQPIAKAHAEMDYNANNNAYFYLQYNQKKKIHQAVEIKMLNYRFRIESEGYQQSDWINANLTGKSVFKKKIVMKRGVAIQLRLTAERGEVPEEVKIKLIERRNGRRDECTAKYNKEKALHQFILSNQKVLEFIVDAKGYVESKPVELRGDAIDTTTYEILLQSGFHVSGMVIGESGEPVAKANLSMADANHSTYKNEKSNDKGEFNIGGLLAGEYKITVQHKDFSQKRFSLDVQADLENQTIRLSKGCAISGVVVNEEGLVIPNVRIHIRSSQENDDSSQWSSSAKSDKNGQFAFKNVQPGPYNLNASAKEHGIAENVPLLVVEGVPTAECRITLSAGLPISGIVVDEKGAPIPKINVYANPIVYNRNNGAQLTSISDAEGKFRILGLSKGKYYVNAHGENHEMTQPKGNRNNSMWDAGKDDVRIVMKPIQFITGSVTDVDGKTMNSYQLFSMFKLNEGQSYQNQLHQVEIKKGVFQFRSNQIGAQGNKRFQLVAQAPNFGPGRSKEMTLDEAHAAPIHIQLTAAFSQSFQIVNSSSEPLPGVDVVANLGNGYINDDANGERSSSNGEVEFKGLGRENYKFKFDHPDYSSTTLMLDLRNGALEKQTVVLQKGGTLQGSALDENGSPMVKAQVNLNIANYKQKRDEYELSGYYHGTTDSNGQFEIKAIRPGQYIVQIVKNRSNESYSYAPPDPERNKVEIREGEVTEFNYREESDPEAGTIQGKLLIENPTYGYVSLIPKVATPENMKRSMGTNVRKSAFTLEKVKPGAYIIMLYSHDGSGSLRKEVDVGKGETVEVIFEENKIFLKARVLDDQGEPLIGGQGMLLPNHIVSLDPQMMGMNQIESVGTIMGGELKIGVSKAGIYRLNIMDYGGMNGDGPAFQPLSIDNIQMRDNETYDAGEIRMKKGFPFTAKLAEKINAPHPFASLVITKDGVSTPNFAMINGDKLAIQNAPALPFTLKIMVQDFEPLELNVVQDNPVIELTPSKKD